MESIVTALVLVIIASIVDWQKAKESWAWAWRTLWPKYIAIFVAIVFVTSIPTFLVGSVTAIAVYYFSDTIITFVLGLYNKYIKKTPPTTGKV